MPDRRKFTISLNAGFIRRRYEGHHAAKAVPIGVRLVDVGSVTSTVRPVAALDAVRAPLPQVSNSAAADLPVTAIVPRAEGAAASGNDRRGPVIDPHADLEHRVIIDPDTQEVVFQSVDSAQSVVRQYPDQAILRRKAYLQKSEEHPAASDPAAQVHRIV